MKITDEMRQRFRDLFWQQRELKNPDALGSAFEAALADVPEPGELSELDRGCFESMKNNAATMRRHIAQYRQRIAELEAQLAEGADTVMARAQTAAEEIGRQLSYAKRAEAAEAQLDKARAWHQQAHCECFSGDGLDALDAILKEGP